MLNIFKVDSIVFICFLIIPETSKLEHADCRFKEGGLGKKEGVVFLREVWYVNAQCV